MPPRRLVPLLSVIACIALAAHAEPDEAVLGRDGGYPLGSAFTWYSNPYRVGSWSAMDHVSGLPVRVVRAPPQARPLGPPSVEAAVPALGYRFRGAAYTLDDYLERRRVTGLMVLKNCHVHAERYRYGRTPQSRFLSFSMAKSVTSLLVGIARERGIIASLDDPAERYARELAGSAYGATTIAQLLRMSSGLTFTERYDGNDDIARLSRAAAIGQPPVLEVLRGVGERHAAAGTKFVYASAETEVLGRVLTAATGRTVSDLTSEWLWQPLGAERDAFWVLTQDGRERVWGFFNATLRDWARLGCLLAADGRIGERQIVPREYLLDATDARRQPAAFQPRRATPYVGYGYQFWLLPMRERTFALFGVHGQAVFVQPASGIVMVHTAAEEAARDPSAQERDALWRGVLHSLGGSTEP